MASAGPDGKRRGATGGGGCPSEDGPSTCSRCKKAGGALGLSELGAASGLGRAPAHTHAGQPRLRPARKPPGVTRWAHGLSGSARPKPHARRLAAAIPGRLVREGRETANLAMLNSNKVVYLAPRCPARTRCGCSPRGQPGAGALYGGRQGHAHAAPSSPRKSGAPAHLDPHRRRRARSAASPPRGDPRKQGYAVDEAEREIGVRCFRGGRAQRATARRGHLHLGTAGPDDRRGPRPASCPPSAHQPWSCPSHAHRAARPSASPWRRTW